MRSLQVLLGMGVGIVLALPVACDMGTPGSPGTHFNAPAAAKSPSGGGPKAGDAGGATPDGGLDTGVDAGQAPPPPPVGWLALAGAHGMFGQTYDDTRWTTRPVAGVDLFAVSCVTNLSGWVAGAGGFVAHTPDGGWSFDIQTTPFTGDLRAIHFDGEQNGVVAGDGGAIAITFDGGAHWTQQDAGTTHTLRGVTMAEAATTIVAVGDAGTMVISTDLGAKWQTVALAGAGNLRAVATNDSANELLAVDDLGQIWSSTSGPTGLHVVATAPAALEAVALSGDGSAAVAAGAKGTALVRFSGSWEILQTGTTVDLHAAMIPWRMDQIYIGGDRGTLRTSLDHGAHFTAVDIGSSAPVFALEDL